MFTLTLLYGTISLWSLNFGLGGLTPEMVANLSHQGAPGVASVDWNMVLSDEASEEDTGSVVTDRLLSPAIDGSREELKARVNELTGFLIDRYMRINELTQRLEALEEENRMLKKQVQMQGVQTVHDAR